MHMWHQINTKKLENCSKDELIRLVDTQKSEVEALKKRVLSLMKQKEKLENDATVLAECITKPKKLRTLSYREFTCMHPEIAKAVAVIKLRSAEPKLTDDMIEYLVKEKNRLHLKYMLNLTGFLNDYDTSTPSGVLKCIMDYLDSATTPKKIDLKYIHQRYKVLKHAILVAYERLDRMGAGPELESVFNHLLQELDQLEGIHAEHQNALEDEGAKKKLFHRWIERRNSILQRLEESVLKFSRSNDSKECSEEEG